MEGVEGLPNPLKTLLQKLMSLTPDTALQTLVALRQLY